MIISQSGGQGVKREPREHTFSTQNPVFVLLANDSVNVQKWRVGMATIIKGHIGNITQI